MRTGDITGDGIADIVVGADQEDSPGAPDSGAAYVIRGGAHLAHTQTIDLADFGNTALAGHLARITPPPGSQEFHFGATCQITDLDINGRGEVLIAATLLRAGAALPAAGAPAGSAHSQGGSAHGTLYIAWDDNFMQQPWPAGFSFGMEATPGSRSVIDGAHGDTSFGEEIIGGLDYDRNGTADLFVGDLGGDGSPNQDRRRSGIGYVFYNAEQLKGRELNLNTPPADLTISRFLGAGIGDISADTAAQGDFDNDGFTDLAFSAPHNSPLGRSDAGTLYIIHGRNSPWPETTDLKPDQPRADIRITEIYGAKGATFGDAGDTLAYSAATGDLNGDGRVDIITNEMLGNGLSSTARDTGNLIAINSALIPGPPRSSPTLSVWALVLLGGFLGLLGGIRRFRHA